LPHTKTNKQTNKVQTYTQIHNVPGLVKSSVGWFSVCLFVLENRWVWVSEDFFETRIDSFFSKKKIIFNKPKEGFKKLEKIILLGF
jgi:hypothetical protein